MLKLRKVAITGGLSCGKSSVCRILKELGAYVVSADEVVHHLLSSDTNLGQEIVKLLGTDVLLNNQINRSRIARIVFEDNELLQELENLVHPAVYKEIEKKYQEQQTALHPPSLFVAEIPLLFESGGEKDYDYTVAVIADPVVCFQRFWEATGYSEREFEKRMDRQLPLLEKALRADYAIINNDSLSFLQETTKELYQELVES